MDQNQTQSAATRLASKLEALDLDDEERSVLVAMLGAGAASVEPGGEVTGFAADVFNSFSPVRLGPGVAADEAPQETVTFNFGHIQFKYQQT